MLPEFALDSKKVLPELAQEPKNVLPELAQETKKVLPETAQETKKVLPEPAQKTELFLAVFTRQSPQICITYQQLIYLSSKISKVLGKFSI